MQVCSQRQNGINNTPVYTYTIDVKNVLEKNKKR